MRDVILQHLNRGTESRNFIHKKIIGFGSKLIAQSGIPVLSQAARVGRTAFGARGTSRDPRFIAARASALTRGNQASTFGRGRNAFEAVVNAKRFGMESDRLLQTNGNCATCKPSSDRGTHLNKTGYYVQSVPGNPAAGGTWVEPESTCVRNRRRNLSNGRANTRAISRVSGVGNQVKNLKKAARDLNRAVNHR